MRKTLLAAAAAVRGRRRRRRQPDAATRSRRRRLAGRPPAPGGWTHGGPHPGPMGWMHRWREHHRPIAPGTFALVYRQADRNLTPPDVQKIAEAFLLWNGNHTWKVVDVAAASDGAIGFAWQRGGLGDRPLHDGPHSGRVTRAG